MIGFSWIKEMFGKIGKRIKSLKNAIIESYVSAVQNWPVMVFCTYFVITGIASFHSIYFHMSEVSFNARTGFETRGTFRSGERLALEHLIANSVSKPNLIMPKNRIKRSASGVTEAPRNAEVTEASGNDNFTINYDDYGVDDGEEKITPCGTYLSLGTPKFKYLYLDFLTKAIFEVESFDKLFEVSTLKTLCKLDEIIDRVANETKLHDFIMPLLEFSLNLPNYVICANGSYVKTCDDLDQNTANSFKSLVISCLNPQTESEILNCKTNFAMQIQDYILQKPNENHEIPDGPIYIGAILKVFNNYGHSASPETLNYFYSTLMHHLSHDFGDVIKLKGLFIGAKDSFFQKALFSDIALGAGALFMVILGILFYSKSLTFTIIVLVGMAFAVGTSFFFYAAILRISFFPFINFLVVVIAIAVGADDAFLLTYQFEKHKKELKAYNAKLLNIDSDLLSQKEKLGNSYNFNETWEFGALDLQNRSQVIKAAVHEALKHAAIAMFVTSITTAIAFLTNCFSSILILRCFGIFAATTILANYIFVISALPAALVLLHSKPCFEFDLNQGIFYRIQSGLTFVSNIYIYRLPIFIYKTFYAILFTALLLFIGSIYVVCVNPGIRLPENNAMQILRSNHPFEWFEEHQNEYFNFSSHQAIMLNFFAIWGLQPTTDSSWLIAEDSGTLQKDPAFKLSKQFLENLDLQMSMIKRGEFIDSITKRKNITWARSFLNWIDECPMEECCWENTNILPDMCVLNYTIEHNYYFQPDAFGQVRRIKETPLIEKETLEFLGIMIEGPSNYPLTNTYRDLQPLFSQFDSTKNQLCNSKPMLLTNPTTTNLFDLLNSLLYGTTISVAISLAISALVIIFSTMRPLLSFAAIISIAFSISSITAILLLFGWTINVVEATILVITIGLCFDYTLHLAVAYKLSSDIVVTEKVREANEACAIPIALASITNIAAGLILFFSQTQAFYEIGVFLVVMTIVSFLTAHFVFVSLIYLFSKFCRNDKI